MKRFPNILMISLTCLCCNLSAQATTPPPPKKKTVMKTIGLVALGIGLITLGIFFASHNTGSSHKSSDS